MGLYIPYFTKKNNIFIPIEYIHKYILYFTDKLTKNLVMEMYDWDREDSLNKLPMERANTRMDNLIKVINSCGVSFNVWQKMDANGRESGLQDYTSLMGSNKKLLLQKLPSKLGDVVKPETGETVIKLWKVYMYTV